MAFIVLRRSRNTKSYYLVESYRDREGRSCKRTLCYLGREQDGTDTLPRALAHWERVRDQVGRELRSARGSRKATLRRKQAAAAARIALLRQQVKRAESIAAERRERESRLEEARLWLAFDRLRHRPCEEHALEAKRAFLTLAKRHHPDQGGTHEGFLRLKAAYDQAQAVWRAVASRQ